MTKRVVLLFFTAVLCLSCEEYADGQMTYRELLKLRDAIEREFKEDVADVTVTTDKRMTVKFVNSPFRLRPSAEKQQRADAVAEFVSRNYRQPLSSVAIQYAGETYVGRLTGKP